MTDDLLFQDQIRDLVRSTYRRASAGAGRAMASRLYDPEQLEHVPEDAVMWSLGVGNPTRHARLEPGEVVVDLGCGGGIDTILAARAVGPTGQAIGIDTLPEMCERTRRSAEESGVADWCTVLQGEMEELPLPDGSVDVVISNGVVNLSPRKSRALAEVVRVLRDRGRFCVADLTVDEDLPAEVLTSGAAWAGCIGGAMSEDLFARKLERAGLVDVWMEERIPFSIDDIAAYPLFLDDLIELMRDLIPPEDQQAIATSVIVHATRGD